MSALVAPLPFAPRAVCDRCRRPARVCVCAVTVPLQTQTRVVIVQHPRERRMGVGTARLAHLALAGSSLHVGVALDDDPALAELLSQAERAGDTYVLFPGPQARALDEVPRDRPLTLIAVDGTWSQARKLLRLNPRLAALPRVAFRPRQPSAYRIRRQPAAGCVSTIEALFTALEELEPATVPLERLLQPFAAMVAEQERFVTEVHTRRHFRAPREPAVRPRLGAMWKVPWERLVCVHGEANAWPHRERAQHGPPHLVHWVAHRPASGETLNVFVAPRGELSPSTPAHAEVASSSLMAGVSVETWRALWAGFTAPHDVVVAWGRYVTDLARTDGLLAEQAVLDLRSGTGQQLGARVGTIETALTRIPSETAPLGPGRAGRRLAGMRDLLKFLY